MPVLLCYSLVHSFTMSTPAFGCPFCSAIFAEEDQMLCHFLLESSVSGKTICFLFGVTS